MKRHVRSLIALGCALVLPAAAQGLEARVHAFTLDNGLRVLMVVEPSAPVIHFNLMFDVGGVDEPPGLGGIAHMVEHMAFKGTASIGSRDPEAEAEALAAVERALDALEAARARDADAAEVRRLEATFQEAREQAQRLAIPNALDNLFSANGAAGLNAGTGYDFTSFVVSLPKNRLELYARVYADVLLNPVFRSFYEERDVVREERRQRSEDDPQGFLFERFLGAAFERHPYGRPLIGSAEEIEGYRTAEAQAFFERFYHPNRAVLVMVGDLEPERDIQVIERFFGAVPQGPEARVPIPEEPPQSREKRITVRYDAEPQLAIGYHKPTYPERDAFVMDVIDALLSSGRTSRLFKRLVLEERLALDVSTSSSFPGARFPNLFLIFAQPRFPNPPEAVEAAVYAELERLKTEPVPERELEKVKNQVRAGFVRALASGPGLAQQLAFYELFLGGWENLLTYADTIQTVTAEEVQAAARRYFVPENRTVAILLPKDASEGGEAP
ncbi:M16 family metallopeptidase [Marinithermus hydrothermalis]|uniref:Peptidase M16 domain protein n=1 Tax=Marinithermus hydrothermalis (strain DSM 14884 / JCM 11576 / T1) TaxID=869210 RepID=F2NKJ5_MARHT|nr:pitrilysin family protein [Marinithermus hydrothermalis]AEB12655.1 peptidase M16 domain protein [Marinithermus hydrothermalis DSM 14884]